MNQIKYLLVLLIFLLGACAKEKEKISVIKETKQDLEMACSGKSG